MVLESKASHTGHECGLSSDESAEICAMGGLVSITSLRKKTTEKSKRLQAKLLFQIIESSINALIKETNMVLDD